jgi:DNA-binding SARP family transcriptional activator
MHRLLPPSPDAERWPWPIRIRTLGCFEIERDGTQLRFEGKAQRQPLKMLKILIAAGERPLPIRP